MTKVKRKKRSVKMEVQLPGLAFKAIKAIANYACVSVEDVVNVILATEIVKYELRKRKND